MLVYYYETGYPRLIPILYLLIIHKHRAISFDTENVCNWKRVVK